MKFEEVLFVEITFLRVNISSQEGVHICQNKWEFILEILRTQGLCLVQGLLSRCEKTGVTSVILAPPPIVRGEKGKRSKSHGANLYDTGPLTLA